MSFLFLRGAISSARAEPSAKDAVGCSAAHAAELANAVKITATTMAAITRRRNFVLFAEIILTSS